REKAAAIDQLARRPGRETERGQLRLGIAVEDTRGERQTESIGPAVEDAEARDGDCLLNVEVHAQGAAEGLLTDRAGRHLVGDRRGHRAIFEELHVRSEGAHLRTLGGSLDGAPTDREEYTGNER